MTETRGPSVGSSGVSREGLREELPAPTAWTGWVVFAGAIMVIVGGFHVIAGLVALFNDEYFLVGKNGLLVELDYTAWGWVHLSVGVVVLAAGYALFLGKTWARVVAIVLAMLSAILNLGSLAAYPIWSTIIIALDVVVIYAVAVHGDEVRPDWR